MNNHLTICEKKAIIDYVYRFTEWGGIKMKFIVSASSDVGITKKTNQDSAMVKVLSLDGEEAALGVICDGVGGLSKGEVASATVIKAMEQWFLTRFPELIYSDRLEDAVFSDWKKLIDVYNQKIRNYGKMNEIMLGTTISAILIWKDQYYVVNVGDSRVYEMGESLRIITKDQTIVEFELANGMITPEQAKTDKRKNILLQCIGASEVVIPDFFKGDALGNTVYVLCSDGFRHLITEDELYEAFCPENTRAEFEIKSNELELIELNKKRQEKDNISVLTIKIR